MLTLSQPAHYTISPPAEELCYTQLQPVGELGSLITTSTDLCLPQYEIVEELSCVEYVIQTAGAPDQYGYSAGDLILPCSPESLVEEDYMFIHEDDFKHTRITESSTVCQDEDDDASVILDFMDLSFLDQESSSEDVDSGIVPEDSFHITQDSLDSCPTVVVTTNTDNIPYFTKLSPSPPPLALSPPLTPSAASTTTTTTTTLDNSSNDNRTSSNSSTASSWSIQYCNLPGRTITIIDTRSNTITSNKSDLDIDGLIHVLPPSPVPSSTDSTSSLSEMVNAETMTSSGSDGEDESEMMDSGHVSENDDENIDVEVNIDEDIGDEDETDFKPYCNSRKGAKKNLLWKFLLWSLDHHSDIVRWTDVQKGIFKFVDTARISSLWGQRKRKTGMTFEKLSRGIRHYYKRGLMERQSNTRLVYKFNWDKVPRRYRKA